MKSIPLFVGNPRNKNAIDFFEKFEIHVLLSINYLFLLPAEIYSSSKIISINLHGSLLPKYRGRTPHVWAIINDEKYTGITAHIINEKCDEGDILFQKKIKIDSDDTGGSLLKKFENEYPLIISYVLNIIKKSKIKLTKQNNKIASFYPKRVEEDGLINWNWSSREIYNWVRALAFPYPMAFTFYKSQKIKINKVMCTNKIVRSDEPGTIISTSPLEVKTSDGSVVIIEFDGFKKKFEIKTNFQDE